MKYIAGEEKFKLRNSAVTLGKFDGLHLGHQHLISQVISYREKGLTAVMFSFLYHPGSLFSDKEFELIYTEEEKKRIVQSSGLDVLVSYPFTEITKNIEPEDFIKEILVNKLDAKVILIGKDFRFGKGRRGDVTMLMEYGKEYGYRVIACDKLMWKNQMISSSTIRSALAQGDMETVNSMLGNPYSIMGEVMHGRRIGRTLGMPTTNLIPSPNKLLPPNGVYVSKTIIDGISYPGVTNIGYKPSVGADPFKGVETYLFDYDADLYGKDIEVELYHFQRPEIHFASLDDLKQKMQEDITWTRKYFANL